MILSIRPFSIWPEQSEEPSLGRARLGGPFFLYTMNDLRPQFYKARILPQLLSCLQLGQSCHLVGGALRDFLLGRAITDFDFATSFDPTDLARTFARQIDGHWFLLDEKRRQSRVVCKADGFPYTYDFAPFRASSLHGDLLRRDFTVNAIALDLAGLSPSPHLIDPLGGQGDLKRSILSDCSPCGFADDPLRILRGVRLARVLNFDLEPETFKRMKDSVSGLAQVAPERVGSELIQIFHADDGTRSLPQMEVLGLFPILFGEGSSPQAVAAGIERVQLVSRQLKLLAKDGLSVPAESTFDGFSMSAIVRLAAFLSGSGLLARHCDLLRKMRFSRRVESILKNLVFLTPADGQKLLHLETSDRGYALWVDQLGPAPLVSLLYLASLEEPSGEFRHRARVAMTAYNTHAYNGRVPDLVDGSTLRSTLGLAEGVLVGQVLSALRNEEVEGRVRNLSEAHNYLKLYVEKIIDKPTDHS